MTLYLMLMATLIYVVLREDRTEAELETCQEALDVLKPAEWSIMVGTSNYNQCFAKITLKDSTVQHYLLQDCQDTLLLK